MRRTPREEFLPFSGCEGFVVVFSPTVHIALPFYVVGKADAERPAGWLGETGGPASEEHRRSSRGVGCR
jgi:hypothetical protein